MSGCQNGYETVCKTVKEKRLSSMLVRVQSRTQKTFLKFEDIYFIENFFMADTCNISKSFVKMSWFGFMKRSGLGCCSILGNDTED